MERMTVKLTNKPVSDKMQDILERLGRRENVSIYEIEDTPEIKTARLFVPVDRPTIERRGREEVQQAVYERLMDLGSAVVGEGGEVQYNGSVRRDKRLDIVIGLSASGKSSALVDVLSEEFHSRVVDNDMAKEMIPEYNNGWGAGLVHLESQMISQNVFRTALENHDNMVIPRVGSDPQKLLNDYVIPAKNEGYDVNVHFIDIDRNKAMGRMLSRFIKKGRFIDPSMIDKYAPTNDMNKVVMSYEVLKGHECINGSSKWDNDVEKGTKPILKEYRNLKGEFINNARTEEGELKHGQQNRHDALDTGDRGKSRRSNTQEHDMDRGSQERMGRTHICGQKQDNECAVPYGTCQGDVGNINGGTAFGDVGQAGEIDLTYEDLSGIPFDDNTIKL